MALTVNVLPQAYDVWGGTRVQVADVTFDTSYNVGGEDFKPLDIGLLEFYAVLVSPDSGADQPGYVVNFNYATQRLQVFRVNNHTHTENTAPTYTQNATTGANAQAPLTEVSSGVNLASLRVRVVCIGA